MLDQLSILLMHPLCHAKNVFLVADDRLSEVALDKFVEAFELLDDCVSTLRKFESGTGTIPSCPLLQADEAKAAKAKLDKVPKRTAGHDLKCDNTAGESWLPKGCSSNAMGCTSPAYRLPSASTKVSAIASAALTQN
jgi:hypothetical protein